MTKKNKDVSNFYLLKGIWKALKVKRKRQFFLCSLLMIFSGIAETLSIASIIPFINFLLSPNEIWDNNLTYIIFSKLGFTNIEDPLIGIVCLFTSTIIIAGFFRIFTLWVISKFISILATDFSLESFRMSLYQPYSVHISKNSSEVVALNSVEINQLADVFTYFLRMLLAMTYVFFILIAVFLFDTKLALISFLIFIFIYFSLTILSRFYLRRNSIFISNYRQKQIKFLNEGLGSIKEIIIDNNHMFYIKNFFKIDQPLRKKIAENDFISNSPKALVETIAFMYLAFLALYVVMTSSNGILLLTKITVIAVSCQKVLPQLQQIYASWTRISGNSKAIEKVLYSINQSIPNINISHKSKLEFKNQIFLNNIFFKYKDSKKYVLNGINLKIKKSERIGIIGQTGTGKSTLVDLLIGLLNPSKGNIFVDKIKISNSKKIDLWRSNIAYIPQDIYFADSSIIENIACGLKREDIDITKVIESAKRSQIHDFISKLPLGYETIIGEMGIKLSGGQRQRLGIARAFFNLYSRKKEILVLDEATSALDFKIEDLIMRQLYELNKNLTIIIISHRYKTLEKCDRIIEIKNGSIISDNKKISDI
ncbi:MAG: hypothetical protein CMC78_05460 [Flavobacteriaceae bacterium]|nr:hypothetical protein [Flavobacteriaceae bacterium]|tara:strand:+ start:2604 stop:4388 length:1785 start_codon:yes stop_codon:yes gene_type:complete